MNHGEVGKGEGGCVSVRLAVTGQVGGKGCQRESG